MDKPMMTLIAFALSLGRADRLSLEQSEPMHRSYKKAKEDVQDEMRVEFMTAYIMSRLDVKKVAAGKVLAKEKDSRTEAQQIAYWSANSKFGYHISRTKVSSNGESKAFKLIIAELTAVRRSLRDVPAAKAIKVMKAIKKILIDNDVELI